MYYIPLLLRYIAEKIPEHLAYRKAVFALNAHLSQVEAERDRLLRNYLSLLNQLNLDADEPDEYVALLEAAEQVSTLMPIQVYDVFKNNPGITMKDAAEILGVTYPTLRKNLDILLEEGKIRREGQTIITKEW